MHVKRDRRAMHTINDIASHPCCFPPTLASRSHSHANPGPVIIARCSYSLPFWIESGRSFCFGSTNGLACYGVCSLSMCLCPHACVCAMDRAYTSADGYRIGVYVHTGRRRDCIARCIHVYSPCRVSRPDPDRTQLHTLYAIPNYFDVVCRVAGALCDSLLASF